MLGYEAKDKQAFRLQRVADLFAVPKHIFHPGLIQPRKPLPPEHPRAGDILSNIRLNRIPPEARAPLIQR